MEIKKTHLPRVATTRDAKQRSAIIVVWGQVQCIGFDTNERSRVYHITLYQDKKHYNTALVHLVWSIFIWHFWTVSCLNIPDEMNKQNIYFNSLFQTLCIKWILCQRIHCLEISCTLIIIPKTKIQIKNHLPTSFGATFLLNQTVKTFTIVRTLYLVVIIFCEFCREC